MVNLNFFTRKWYPVNIIIIIISMLFLAVLIWGGVTHWKFIYPKKPHINPPPIPKYTYTIVPTNLNKGTIGYQYPKKGSIIPSNIFQEQELISIYTYSGPEKTLTLNKNITLTYKNAFVIVFKFTNQHTLDKNFFKSVKINTENNQYILSTNSAHFILSSQSSFWLWINNYSNPKWIPNKKYNITFIPPFFPPYIHHIPSPHPSSPHPSPPSSPHPSSPPSPHPSSPPSPHPSPRTCKNFVNHYDIPDNNNLCNLISDCCKSNYSNTQCMACQNGDDVPSFLLCNGNNNNSYCQYENLDNTPIKSQAFSRQFYAITNKGFNFYILGGLKNKKPTNIVDMYSPSKKSWYSFFSQISEMLIERVNFVAVYLNPNLYAIGGWNTSIPNGTSSCEIYGKYSNNQWTSISSMKTNRMGHSGCVFNNKIYIMGGINDTYKAGMNSVEFYNPIFGNWISSDEHAVNSPRPMITRRFFFQTVVFDNKIYAIGGRGNSTVEFYYPSKGWNNAPGLDKAIYNFGAVVAPAPPGKTGVNGMIIYIIGGIDEKGNAINEVKVLNMATNKWESVAELPNPRSNFQAICPFEWNNSGEKQFIYVYGGVDKNNIELNIMIQYDPIANSWREI